MLRVGEKQVFHVKGWEVRIVKITRSIYGVGASSPLGHSYYGHARIRYKDGKIQELRFKRDPDNFKDVEVLVLLLGLILGDGVASVDAEPYWMAVLGSN